LSRTFENNPFTYINNSKVFNGETPTRLSFEENTDKQTKENTELVNNLETRTWPPKVKKVLYLISGELRNSQKIQIKSKTENERKKQIEKINK